MSGDNNIEASKRATLFSAKERALMGHEYSRTSNSESDGDGMETVIELDDTDVTTLQSPARKKPHSRKRKGLATESNRTTEPSLSQLQASILEAVNRRADVLETMINKNSLDIQGMQRTLDKVTEDIQLLQTENKSLSARYTELEKTTGEMEGRLGESERYRRRWALRLRGVKEVKNENAKKVMIDICSAVAPEIGFMELAVDIVHRLGNYQPDKTRPIIVLFAFRAARDAVWVNAKDNAMLKEKNLRFTEDLTKLDKDKREKLWPQIERARKEGKKAGFKGVRGFVEGQEIFG